MSDQSSIEWTDSTWNPVRGCTKISPGCKNCYAETFTERWRGVPGHPYEQGFDLRLVPEKLDEPLRWQKPRRIFVNSMSDLFQDGVDSEFITKVFSVMAAADWHTYQVLTKRPLRMFRYIESHKATLSKMAEVWPIPNIWLGVSVENQEYANSRIPTLLKTPAAKRFVSYEPALGPVDFRPWLTVTRQRDRMLDWIIAGGESGPGARPFDIRWARYAIQQCKAAGVPCFVKQMGSQPQTRNDQVADVWFYGDGSDMDTVEGPDHPEYKYQGGKVTLKLRDRKGGDMSEWPEDLRVREWPLFIKQFP